MKDSYAKECIDALNAFLSEHKNDFVCIIAGYAEQLEKCFFGYNSVLERRFPHVYEIKDYSAEELRDILITRVKNYEWKYDNIESTFPIEYFTLKKKNLFLMEVQWKHYFRK